MALDGGLGVRVPSKDNIVALIAGGVATAQYTTLGTVVRLTTLKDAQNLGFTASYDANNEVYVWGAVKEFFRLNPEGIMYLMVVNQSTTQTAFGSTYLPLLFESSVIRPNERINAVAYKRNPLDTFTPAQTNEIWNEILPAITAANNAKEYLETHGIFPGIIIIDGSFCSDQYNSYEDLRALDKECVAVCVGADWNWQQSLTAYNKFADTATMLGLIAMRKASESMGAPIVQNPPKGYKGQVFETATGKMVSLTDTLASRYLIAAMSSGEKTTDVTDLEVSNLNARGYNYFDRIYGINGKYGVNGATAAAATSDYAWIERYQIVQKAKHYAYQFFTPLKNKEVELVNARLSDEIRAYLENEATNAVLGQLRFEDNISDYTKVEGAGVTLPNDYNFVTGEHDTDPAQNVPPETLVVKMAVPIKGILRQITVYVGLTA